MESEENECGEHRQWARLELSDKDGNNWRYSSWNEPREPSTDESQEGRDRLRRFLRNPFQLRSLSEPPQGRVSEPPSSRTTADNSHSTSKTSRAQTEDTPLTPPSNSGLLSNYPGDLHSPFSVSSTSSQPSIDDHHRRKRALRRQEQKK